MHVAQYSFFKEEPQLTFNKAVTVSASDKYTIPTVVLFALYFL